MTALADWRPSFGAHTPPASPDRALDLLRSMETYRRQFPDRTSETVLTSRSPASPRTVNLRVPDFGTLHYLFMPEITLSVFLTDAQRDFQRVYRYLLLDDTEEESHEVPLSEIQRHLRRHVYLSRLAPLGPDPADRTVFRTGAVPDHRGIHPADAGQGRPE